MWSNGDFTANPINLAPGIYSLQVTDANGCKANANNINVEYEEYEVPVNLGPDLDICPGQTVTLSPGIYSTYLWQDGTMLPVFTLQTAGQYSVQVTDNKGCGEQILYRFVQIARIFISLLALRQTMME